MARLVSAEGPSPGRDRWRPLQVAGLALCAVGVVLNEGVATAGVGLLVLGALWQWAGSGRLGLVPGWRRWWPLGSWLLWAAIAPLLAGRWPTASGAARLFDWLLIPIVAVVVAQVPRRALRGIAIACAVALLASSLAAALQHHGVWRAPADPQAWAWTRIPFYRMAEPAPGLEGRFMAGGLLWHRLKFAHVGGLAVVTATAVALRTRGRARALALVTAVAGAFAIVTFTFTRAATVALALAVPVVIALSWRWSRRSIAAAVGLGVAVVAAVALYAPLRERFVRGLTAEGSGDRPEILQTGLRAVRAHPIVGTGLGQFRPARFATPQTPRHVLENPGKAHNQLVSVAAETGIPGAALLVGALAWIAARIRRDTARGAAALGSLVFFAALSVFHDPLFQPVFSMALALVLGAGLSGGQDDARPAAPEPPAQPGAQRPSSAERSSARA